MRTYAERERHRYHRYHHHHHHHHHHHNFSSSNSKKFSKHATRTTADLPSSKHYLSNVWVRILKFSLAYNLVNFGSSVNARLHVPSKDNVSNMILKLPMVCKYTVLQTCHFLVENILWLAQILASVQRRYKGIEETGSRHEHHERHSGQQHDSTEPRGRLIRYMRSLKWTPIPLSVGFALLAYQHYRRVLRRSTEQNGSNGGGSHLARDWEVTCYRMVPLRAFSRCWGWVHSIDLPVWARTPLFKWYADTFNCNVQEAEIEDLLHYRNLGEFFRRALKQGVRPICNRSHLVSPVDGTVLHCGKVESGNVEQVKGVSYSLPTFLGPRTWDNQNNNNALAELDKQEYCSSLLKNKDNALFHCVIYLAPGDYHRFHSPVEWNVNFRRHFAGELLSVNPVVARWIAGLFSLNERAVYVGEWEHGFFSYTAVGATNVGSIKVYDDKELTTNCWNLKKNTFRDVRFEKPISLGKGSDFGEFNLGSTIVLLFEAPQDFTFSVENGCKIRLGESLFHARECASMQTRTTDANPSL